jgi:hypothetical protein
VDTSEFETKLLTAFTEKLLAYCSAMRRDARFDPKLGLDLTISVVTGWPVPNLRARMRDRAVQVLRRELPGARLDQLFFGVNFDLPEPGYLIGIEYRPPRPPESDRLGHPAPVLLLTLAYAGDHRYVFPLVTTRSWISIRRGPPAPDLRHEISLPDHMNAVPAGVLLELRYAERVVEVRRTANRPQYTVAADDRRLEPGDRVSLGREGWIVYANTAKQTELRYSIVERE